MVENAPEVRLDVFALEDFRDHNVNMVCLLVKSDESSYSEKYESKLTA